MARSEPSETGEDLTAVVRRMVDEPSAVRLRERWRGSKCRFELTAADGDLGKIIGRQGRTAQALRTLLDARGSHEGVDYVLDIVDD